MYGNNCIGSSRHSPERCGASLIDVLLACGILGLLISMMMPAVQAARDAAARVRPVEPA